mgnify:CR=1 FL=1
MKKALVAVGVSLLLMQAVPAVAATIKMGFGEQWNQKPT